MEEELSFTVCSKCHKFIFPEEVLTFLDYKRDSYFFCSIRCGIEFFTEYNLPAHHTTLEKIRLFSKNRIPYDSYLL